MAVYETGGEPGGGTSIPGHHVFRYLVVTTRVLQWNVSPSLENHGGEVDHQFLLSTSLKRGRRRKAVKTGDRAWLEKSPVAVPVDLLCQDLEVPSTFRFCADKTCLTALQIEDPEELLLPEGPQVNNGALRNEP